MTLDRDARIAAWLSDGPDRAPATLLPAISHGLSERPGGLARSLGRGTLGLAAALMALVLAAILLAIVTGGAPKRAIVHLPLSAAPSVAVPTRAPSLAPAAIDQPSPLVAAPSPPLAGATSPAPTVTPGGPWEVPEAGLSLDLPAGWDGPPSAEAVAISLAIASAEGGKPGLDAFLRGPASGSIRVSLHVPATADDAVLRVRLVAAAGPGVPTVAAAAEDLRSTLARFGWPVRVTSMSLPIGPAFVVDSEEVKAAEPYHRRDVTIQTDRGIVRISLETVGPPSKALQASFEAILRSARPFPPG